MGVLFFLVFLFGFEIEGRAELPEKLSEAGLYSEISTKTVLPGLKEFQPQYPLWTDGAVKKRWISLPDGTAIRAERNEQTPEGLIVDFDHWEFPVGTKLFKEFLFFDEGLGRYRRVETRLITKTSENEWDYATYVWDSEESEALKAPESGLVDHFPITGSIKHDIPSIANCRYCHNRGGDSVLGFDALQLSDDIDPLAANQISLGETIRLKQLVEEGLLVGVPEDALQVAPKIQAHSPVERYVGGYFHGNCASCHNQNGAAAFSGLMLRHEGNPLVRADEPFISNSVDKPATYFRIPGVEQTYRIKSGNQEVSSILFRMEATDFARMPSIGSKIVDVDAVTKIKEWIDSL